MPTTTFARTQASHMRAPNANTAYGDATNKIATGAYTSDERRSGLVFDISSIPPTSIVSDAYLSLKLIDRLYQTATNTTYVYRCKRAITTAGTWNTYDGGNGWQTAGGTGANDIDSTALGSVSLTTSSPSTGSRFSISLSVAEIQNMVNGTYPLCSFMLQEVPVTSYDIITFGWSTGDECPNLVITYELAGGYPKIFIMN